MSFGAAQWGQFLAVQARVKALEALGLDTITAAGLALLDDASASAQLTTLGVSTFIKTLLDDTDAATARTTLGFTSASVATTSGTSIDVTGIPAGVSKIIIAFNGVSTNGTSRPIVQIGDAGGIETAGYTGASHDLAGVAITSAALSSGFTVGGAAAANTLQGVCMLTLVSGGIWACKSSISTVTPATILTSGVKALSASPLDRFRLTTVAGVDTFDLGSIGYHFL